MRTRIVTGIIFAVAFIAMCLFAPVWIVYAVLQAFAVIGLFEILKMAAPRAPFTDHLGAYVAGIGLTALAYFAPTTAALGAVVLLSPVIVLGSFLLQPKPIETVAQRMSGALTAVFYVGLLFAALINLATRSSGDASGRAFLLLGAVVMLGDTGAYFMGKYLGRRKLYAIVSPKKTVEGAFGGVLGSILGALLVKVLIASGITWGDVFLVAIPCSVLGQVGDLTESLFKRSYGVKDSGTLLPGHGGILDRFDGVLFAAPYLLLYTTVSPLQLG